MRYNANMLANFLRSLVWFILILVVGTSVTFMVAGAIIRTQLKPDKPVLVRDEVGAGSHTLSGTVPVQSTCDEVTVNTQKTSPTSYALLFTTWHEPYIPSCANQEVMREFHAIIFASSLGVSFTAMLDGSPIPLAVIPEIPLHAPTNHKSTTSTTSTSTLSH